MKECVIMNFRILVVEDDLSIANLIAITLQIKQYDVVKMYNGDDAYKFIQEEIIHLALLDIMLPGKNGYELMEILKSKNIPVIFISAKTELSDKVYGLNLGAEDYITKPFEPLELLARVETALRRIKPESNIIQINDVLVDTNSRKVTKAGKNIELTKLEYELLEFLLRHPDMVFTRDKLLDCVWGYDYSGSTRTVDMHIKNLRSKLDLSGNICTVHKIGYKLIKKVK